MVAEPAKLTRVALALVAPASAVHVVVTTEDAAGDDVDALTAAGVAVKKV